MGGNTYLTRIFLIAIIIMQFSCADNKPSIHKTKLETFIDSFRTNHPDYNSNNIIRDSVIGIFTDQALSMIDGGMLSDIPLKLISIKKVDSLYYGHFEHRPTDGVNVYYHILATLTRSRVDTLKEQSSYYVHGSNAWNVSGRYLSYTDDLILKSKVELDDNSSFHNANLGVILLKTTSITSADTKK